MKKQHIYTLLIFALSISLISPGPVRAQLVLGQYEDEAPIQTWNILGIATAASLGRGGTSFTLVDTSASSLVNPALLVKLPAVSLTLSGSYSTTTFQKYSIINTGVLTTFQNQILGLYAGDFAGASFRVRGWAFSFSAGFMENYIRPEVNWEYGFEGQLYYYMRFDQDGILTNYNFSLAKKITDWLAVGLGLSWVRGKHEKSVEEKWIQSDRSIADFKSHDLRGYYVNGGIVLDVSKKLAAAAVFRTSYVRNADSESLYRFYNPNTDTDIQIDSYEKSTFRQPLVVGVGISYRFIENVSLACDASFFNWSQYKADYFGEPLRRDFKNIVKINAGLEFNSTHTLFNWMVEVPFRVGLIYDPQPMKNPDSYYFGYSLGSGIHFRNLLLDIGYCTANEYGSGQRLAVQKILITLSFHI